MSYYDDLGLQPTVTTEEIEKTYNILLKKINKNERKKIDIAYRTLIDYNSRRKYDYIIQECLNNVIAHNHDNNNYEELNIKNDNNTYNEDSILNNSLNDNDNLKNFLINEFSNIKSRLDKIEKLIYNKSITDNKFYKERKKINTKFHKGKKVVNILTDVNNNGILSSKIKTISYDSDGNQIISYKKLNDKKY